MYIQQLHPAPELAGRDHVYWRREALRREDNHISGNSLSLFNYYLLVFQGN